MRPTRWIAGALLLVGACEGSPTGAAELNDEEAIQEAVFRELMSVAAVPEAAAYCLSVGEWDTRRDPSGPVLQRFRGHSPPVAAGSECSVSAVNGTLHLPSGRRAETFHISALERSGDTARVEAMWQFHGRAAGGYDCEVERRGAAWSVADCRTTWIA